MSDRKNKPKKFKKRGQDSSSSSTSSSESTSSLSSDDESNAKDLKPIKDYLADRKELARQLFIAVKGDKLRMMLPQILKKMELNELEEWCANELSGMSKARILSILNGQPMFQSSDSNDTDDSGPSLEIISDTEEWGDGSDMDAIIREEESISKKVSGSKKDKAKSKSRTERANKEKEKTRSKLKAKVKSEPDPKPQKSSDVVKVKKETEATEQQPKEKDGESLLDLLELEMRARAIRALIRKEEDIIPVNSSSSSIVQSNTSTENQNPSSTASLGSKTRTRDRQLSLKVVQDKLQELDTSFHRSVGKTAQEISEEEDVVLVLQPTTTIELLSSESEDEGGQGKRRNQKLENERIPQNSVAQKVQESSINNEPQVKDAGEKSKVEVRNREKDSETFASEKNKISSTDVELYPISSKILTSETEVRVDNSPERINKDLEMFRMLKKKSQLRTLDDDADQMDQKSLDSIEKGTDETLDTKNIQSSVSEEKQSRVSDNDMQTLSSDPSKDVAEDKKTPDDTAQAVTKPSTIEATEKLTRIESSKRVDEKISKIREQGEVEEDKSTDLEIIIDLDDYPDDMENLETNEKKTKQSIPNSEEKKSEVINKEDETVDQTAETWATRYYQTEDVQSVIKESKIQSEIRKRLRERQRLARLNNSPGLNVPQSISTATTSSADKSTVEKGDSPTTTGSVEEYMALKNVDIAAPSADPVTSRESDELEVEKIKDLVILGNEIDSQKIELTIKDDEKLIAVTSTAIDATE